MDVLTITHQQKIQLKLRKNKRAFVSIENLKQYSHSFPSSAYLHLSSSTTLICTFSSFRESPIIYVHIALCCHGDHYAYTSCACHHIRASGSLGSGVEESWVHLVQCQLELRISRHVYTYSMIWNPEWQWDLRRYLQQKEQACSKFPKCLPTSKHESRNNQDLQKHKQNRKDKSQ